MDKLICIEKTIHLRYLKINKIFGLDFMIDEDFKMYLIEVNTNPCLETSTTLLARLIPNMVENALKFIF